MSNSKQPSSLNHLLQGALARHGIDQRVLAVQVVKVANELLDSYLTDNRRHGVRVVSYAGGELEVVCEHPAAKYMLEGLAGQLKAELEVRFPDLTLKRVKGVVKRGTITEEEWYTDTQL